MTQEIKFGTDGWRAIIAKDFTVENVMRVAKATADWVLKQNSNPSIVVGFDCRFGGSLFAQTAINVFCANNIKVYYDTNFVSTPMISLAAKNLGCELGVIFTASHNPPSYNGYKLKSKHGGPLIQKYITEIEQLIPTAYEVPEKSLEHWSELQLLEFVDLETMYFEHASNYFDLDTISESELVVAYDAMYGAGQSIFPRLLPHTDLLHCEYNPSFYGQAPEPIHKNLTELSEYIKQSKHVDIAIATDGDADRIGLYNRKGEFVDAHHIILLLIHVLHKYKGLNGKVVIAFSVSNKVKTLCQHYGLPFEVTKIGFKHICEIMQNEDVLVGGEESGGIAVKGHIPERDGIWDGLVLVEHLAKNNISLETLIEEVYEIVGKFAYNRLDLHLEESKKQEIIARCKADGFKSFSGIPVTKVEDIDGWKYYLEDEETLMIRASGTEPLLRVYAEAISAERVEEILIKAKQELLG
ncbi:MAG: phosphoglucosamine mutase [Bacteroidetes bacterium 37-13]|nr:MAG: phosphoglucosamine mutase [Bacteroidetes bacterium 37-13]